MKFKSNALIILAMCSMVVGCGGKRGDVVTGSPYDELNGRQVKRVYETLTVSSIASLNYLKTSAAANARYFCNMLDGLLTHSDFGTLELDLAESASHNEEYTEFTFKIREDEHLVWLTYEGTPYVVNGETQYIKADDFVAGAQYVCSFTTGSDTFYLMRDFIKGALEYYLYTEIQNGIAQGSSEFTKLKTDKQKADYIQKTIKNDHENVYYAGKYDENPLTADDIPNIANGRRFGVVADEQANTVKYILMAPAAFFPTLLTYSCYLPVNRAFLKEKKASFGTSSRDSILYNGPYVLSQLDETTILLKKNETYAARADIKGYNSVHVDAVKYNIVKANIDETYTRTQFENGKIDGFSLSPSDTEGWEKYVLGADGQGTIENPSSPLVNSRLLDTIGYAYGTNIVLERTKNASSATSYSTFSTKTSIANTEKALRLVDVRKAIIAAFDYPMYFKRYADGDPDSILASQTLVSTYVPKNFVYDDNGNEYTQKYFAEALADKRGISVAEAQAAIETGTWEHRQQDQAAVNTAVAKAQAAVTAYNNNSALTSEFGGEISYPIYVEYYSLWEDQTTQTYDAQVIESMNKRLNNIDHVEEDLSNCTIFKVIPTDKVDSTNYETADGQSTGAAAFDYAPHAWGWGADYGDPLTYLNTYTTKGDWSSIFYYLTLDSIPNITVEGGVATKSELLTEYTALVKEGQQINDDLNRRYEKFAEAEVMLIEDLAIYAPQTNDGQGWALSISKAAGYESPTSNYGLSNDRLTGLWVLTEPLTGDVRQRLRAAQAEAKAAYTSTHPNYNIYGE